MDKYLITPPKSSKNSSKRSVDTPHEILSSRAKHKRVKNLKGRKASSAAWLRRHINDPFVHAAKKDGFLSRAAYKLIEIDNKYHFLKPGMKVLDLGSSPGSWMQVISQKCKGGGFILVGLDLVNFDINSVSDFLHSSVFFVQGDFTDLTVQDSVMTLFGDSKIDLIVSDIAPSVIGSQRADHLAIMNIIEELELFVKKHLKFNGSLVMKIFHGNEQNSLIKRLRDSFSSVSMFKPAASRRGSVEMYVIASGKKT